MIPNVRSPDRRAALLDTPGGWPTQKPSRVPYDHPTK